MAEISGVLYIDGEVTEMQELTFYFDKQCKGEKIRVNSAINDNSDKTQAFSVTVSPVTENKTVKKVKKANKKKKK